MKLNKIIFLDLDGPIFYLGQPMYNAIYCLSELVRLCDAKIVITSSWRLGKSVEDLKDMLAIYEGFPYNEIIGKTEAIYYKDLEINRGAEIDIYLREHEDEISRYVIIDDIDCCILYQRDYFVKTPHTSGFSSESFRKALVILG